MFMGVPEGAPYFFAQKTSTVLVSCKYSACLVRVSFPYRSYHGTVIKNELSPPISAIIK